MLSREAVYTHFIVLDLTHDRESNPQSTTIEVSMLIITPPMRLYPIREETYALFLYPQNFLGESALYNQCSINIKVCMFNSHQ
jgi:hypothetical protein